MNRPPTRCPWVLASVALPVGLLLATSSHAANPIITNVFVTDPAAPRPVFQLGGTVIVADCERGSVDLP